MSDKNIEIAKDIYAAFMRGDVPTIMQHMSDDLQGFGVVSKEKLIPWHIQILKKQNVPKFFQAIDKSSTFTRFEPRDFAAGGDYVYCTISFAST
jgi:ketosteroid isomerase-like protein